MTEACALSGLEVQGQRGGDDAGDGAGEEGDERSSRRFPLLSLDTLLPAEVCRHFRQEDVFWRRGLGLAGEMDAGINEPGGRCVRLACCKERACCEDCAENITWRVADDGAAASPPAPCLCANHVMARSITSASLRTPPRHAPQETIRQCHLLTAALLSRPSPA